MIETYTITYTGEAPSGGFVFGRLPDGARFVSTVPTDPALLAQMVSQDQLGRHGTVKAGPKGNVFTPA